MALSDLASEQSLRIATSLDKVKKLLNYLATHPDTKIRYYESNMILHVHSDGSYLSAPKSQSRAGGFFFLSNNPINPDQAILNDTIHILCKILKNIMGSAAEVEIASAFVNCQDA